MKSLGLLAMSLALLGSSAGYASAQPRDPRFDGGHPPPPQFDGGRGPGPQDHRDYRRGDRMPRNDWDRGARVDYREHHLRPPPRGYEWRQVDGRFILGAIATGVIADIILNAR